MTRKNDHHHDRVNRVLDYIGQHLDEDLSLTRLSEIGCFSPFHFHRIFIGATGETLNNHVRRVRLERAALLMKTSPRKRITDVALEAGFAGTAEFSRAFRNHFGRTASSWDRRSPLEKSKICKAPEMLSFYALEELESWKAAAKVRVHASRLTRISLCLYPSPRALWQQPIGRRLSLAHRMVGGARHRRPRRGFHRDVAR